MINNNFNYLAVKCCIFINSVNQVVLKTSENLIFKICSVLCLKSSAPVCILDVLIIKCKY